MLRRLLPLVLVLGAGCHTAIGNYLANRARDFDECFRLEVGACVGIGAGVEVAGLADLGLGGYGGVSAGLDYGDFGTREAIQAWFPVSYFALKTGHFDAGRIGHFCWSGAPVATTRSGFKTRKWLWDETGERGRWLRIHAYDIEVSAAVMPVLVRAGFSPGEFLDFLSGWFGVDIAEDDRRLTADSEP